MGLSSTQSSPTVKSPRFSLQPALNFNILSPPAFPITMSDELPEEAPALNREQQPADPTFFELDAPGIATDHVKIEDVMNRLFSDEHLHHILSDHGLFYKFSTFLNQYRPHLIPTLIRYLEMRKAIKAIEYSNAVARGIRWPSHTDYCKFARVQAASTDVRFEDYAARELALLRVEALPAFITHTCVGVVVDCVSRDISGQQVPVLQNLLGSLAEVFCLTDPSKHDNPIIFASEEFHKTTQYGTSYAIERNCRFLQGPGTDKDCTLRITKAITLGQECNEIILNYRRDGTPFANLLMCAPLFDDKGKVRYFIGAQVDITGLVENGLGIESFRSLLQKEEQKVTERTQSPDFRHKRDVSWQTRKAKESLKTLQELGKMFSQEESDIVNKSSRNSDDSGYDGNSISSEMTASVKNRGQTKRIISSEEDVGNGLNFSHLSLSHMNIPSANLPGIYKHYLLVRPWPSLQINFVSPSLRLPGLVRSHLFSKLGGPTSTISALEGAMRDGASVTAKILWLPRNTIPGDRGHAEAKPRYIRCTPLLGSDDRVGVWMVILVPVDGDDPLEKLRRRNEMINDMESVHRFRNMSRSSSRAGTSSTNEDMDLSFGLRGSPAGVAGAGTKTPVMRGRADDESQLYARYLRSSSSIGSTMDLRRERRTDAGVITEKDRERET